MATCCIYCLKDLSKWQQLDFSADIICDDCVQKLVMGYKMKNGQWWNIKKEYPKYARRK